MTLRLSCANCAGEMIRHTAGGLRIGDRYVIVTDALAGNYAEVCGHCGHEHRPGDKIWYYHRSQTQERQYDHK